MDGTSTAATQYNFAYMGSQTISAGFKGFNIPPSSDRPDMIGFECEPGYYCSSASTKIPCPSGTFNPAPRAYSSTQCLSCPPGYLCVTVAGSASGVGDYEQFPCPGGSYCKSGAITASTCPDGTYRNKFRGIEKGSCDQCPDGFYCPAGTINPATCSRGKICPIGSSSEIDCPEGTYNLFTAKYKLEDCIICPLGSTCGIGATTPVWCPPGQYNPYTGSSTCFPCTAGYACIGYKTIKPYIKCQIGYYCPEGSKVPIQTACPPGTVGNMYGAYSVTQCDKCPPGFYCGYATNYVNNPPKPCPAGYYCPIGTESAIHHPCLAGTYNAKTRVEGSHECLVCPAGYYCLNATSTFPPPNVCPAGFYCPRGTQFASQYSCPAGTYMGTTQATNLGSCLMCPKGKYCPLATTTPVNCPAGTYMDELGATDAGPGTYSSCKPCPAGYYSSSPGSFSCTAAAAGYFTYEGATSQTTCVVGYFCAEAGTSEYVMHSSPCPSGYLCPAGTSTYPSQLNNACPVGFYCPEGATATIPCPIGTYRNTVAAGSIYECTIVPAGFYVAITGVSDYSSYVCSAGYYCPAGSISSTAFSCPKGTYRSLTGGKSASDCASCTPGYYCPSLNTVNPTNCPAGSYCPAGTITPIQCPSGTFDSALNLKTSSDCTPCTAGNYCNSPGQTTITGSCTAGYYCIGGSTLQAPTDGVTGALCPAGGYCLAGASVPSTCSAGYFNNFLGGYSSADCVACWPGYYCLGDNNPSPTAQCNAGYYCTGSSTTATQNQATAGYYAPQGSVAQIPCLQGTYNPSVGQSSCSPCPAGTSCQTTALTTYTTCGAGTYCVQGSYVETPCPPGTYKSSSGGQSVNDCVLCSGGNFCSMYGLTTVSGSCDAGYFCTSSSFSNQPSNLNTGFYGRCPQGYYCEAGSTNGVVCPAGTYNPTTGAESLSGCNNCPAGYACPNTATVMYSIQCRRGFYCPQSSTNYEPPASICTAGNYCPTGSAVMLKCPAGTYQDQTEQYSCQTCPPGFYCPIGCTTYVPNICPMGYYCPSGTTYSTQYPCPVGTYNPLQGQQLQSTCQSCTPGYYCNTLGQSAVTGACAAGFYCNAGSTSPRPINAAQGGGICTKGTYCPSGSTSPTNCDPGYYCPNNQMSATAGKCAAGYYCVSGATSPTPTDGTTGNICPSQSYCPAGTSTPIQCNVGYLIPYEGAFQSSECVACTPGFYCDGDSVTPAKPCTAGYYCPGGDSNPTYQCTRGYYCPTGSAEALLCPAGTYQASALASSCTSCSAGYYCALGAYSQTLCPKGYYCPAATEYNYQYPCPVGTYNSNIGQSSISSCLPCDAGKYCSQQGATSATSLCDPGYYCIKSAIVSNPTDGITGDVCLPGYYCPQGSTAPTSCDPGSYCNQKALSQVSGSCLQGYYCIINATSPIPTDGITGNICPFGNYCPAGSSSPQQCQQGTYGPSSGLGASTDCLLCSYGRYCGSTGLSAPTGNCSQGYYCDPGESSSTPIDGICPAGYFCDNNNYYVQVPCFMGTYNSFTTQSSCNACPAGSYCTGSTALPIVCEKGYNCPASTRFSHEFPCGPGYYSDVVGNSVCSLCPQGYYCNNAAQSSNNICPINKYCPAGSGYGLLCPPGTYNSYSQGLSSSSGCTQCPAGQYCIDGTITGQCSSGFYCIGGSSTPTPVNLMPYGQPCPAGHYCPLGTTSPILCPDGKFRKDTGARNSSDCTSCPPGSYCKSGVTTPFNCTTGHYCPLGIQVPLPCPMYTYNDQQNADNPNACKICPAGYFCSTTGISYYTDYPCSPGYFCIQGATAKLNCPPGTITYSKNAGSIKDCLNCPGGNYCPANTTNMIPCPLGTYCPGGNDFYWPCPPGYICNNETKTPVPCSVGSYCPLYDRTNASLFTLPILCDSNNLCPGGYFDQGTCRAGYYFNKVVCKKCPPGYYSDGQKSEACKQCEQGYICTGGATKKNPQSSADGGYPCPKGYYCPLGILSPIPCPIATYNSQSAAYSNSSCLPCPSGTYGESEGESLCRNCGPNAISTEGNTTCTCIGKYRNYQYYDGSCYCIQTYQFYYNGLLVSEIDSAVDCFPIQYENCLSGYIRASNGKCVDKTDCKAQCFNNPGTYNEKSGMCICSNVKSEDAICDSNCRASLPAVTLDSYGNFIVYDPNSGASINISITQSNYLKNTKYTGTSKVHSVSCSNDGMQGKYGISDGVQGPYYSSKDNRRLDISSSGISGALACISANDTFVFTLTPKNHFPVYLKDSLLNTNKDFDYSSFKELYSRMQSSQSNVDLYAFTFVSAGIYDFVDNANYDDHIIIVVKGSGETCPSSKIFYARTTENLALLGIVNAQNIITGPQ